MQATLNVRMDKALKERGDRVLSENGISVSAAVRSLWEMLATTRTIPDFLKDDSEQEEAKRMKRKALERLSSIETRTKSTTELDSDEAKPLPSFNALKEEMYDALWAEYEALR